PAFTATPTPLPAPLPLPSVMTPPHGIPTAQYGQPNAPVGEQPPTRSTPTLAPLQLTPAFGQPSMGRGDEATGAFSTIGGEPAPQFAESYVGSLPPPPGAPPAATGGTVPANPFAEISDGAIEYFVAWSLEQSTAAHPKSK